MSSILEEPHATAEGEAATLLGEFAACVLRMCAETTPWHTRVGHPLSDLSKELVSLLEDKERQRLSGTDDRVMMATCLYVKERDVKAVASAMEETRDFAPLVANHLRVISMSKQQRNDLVRLNQQGRDKRIRGFQQRRTLPAANAAKSVADYHLAALVYLHVHSGKEYFMHEMDRVIPSKEKAADKNVPTRPTHILPRASSFKVSGATTTATTTTPGGSRGTSSEKSDGDLNALPTKLGFQDQMGCIFTKEQQAAEDVIEDVIKTIEGTTFQDVQISAVEGVQAPTLPSTMPTNLYSNSTKNIPLVAPSTPVPTISSSATATVSKSTKASKERPQLVPIKTHHQPPTVHSGESSPVTPTKLRPATILPATVIVEESSNLIEKSEGTSFTMATNETLQKKAPTQKSEFSLATSSSTATTAALPESSKKPDNSTPEAPVKSRRKKRASNPIPESGPSAGLSTAIENLSESCKQPDGSTIVAPIKKRASFLSPESSLPAGPSAVTATLPKSNNAPIKYASTETQTGPVQIAELDLPTSSSAATATLPKSKKAPSEYASKRTETRRRKKPAPTQGTDSSLPGNPSGNTATVPKGNKRLPRYRGPWPKNDEEWEQLLAANRASPVASNFSPFNAFASRPDGPPIAATAASPPLQSKKSEEGK